MSRAQKLFEQAVAWEKAKAIHKKKQLIQTMDLIYEEMNQRSLDGYFNWCLSSHSLSHKGVNLSSLGLDLIANWLQDEGFTIIHRTYENYT